MGRVTAGYHINVRLLVATPLGMQVTAKVELVSQERRMLEFRIEAYDEVEKIGEGTHIRAVIDVEHFKAQLAAKSPV